MENGHSDGMGDAFYMKPLDQRGGTRSYKDVLNRRLKNRERQHRYRARKRLEQDSKKGSDTKQLTQAKVEGQSNGVTRVHCKRDWKKDARIAHLSKRPAVTANYPATNSSATLVNESEAPHLLLQMRTDSDLHLANLSSSDNIEIKATTPSRRDWKADARNKKI